MDVKGSYLKGVTLFRNKEFVENSGMVTFNKATGNNKVGTITYKPSKGVETTVGIETSGNDSAKKKMLAIMYELEYRYPDQPAEAAKVMDQILIDGRIDESELEQLGVK